MASRKRVKREKEIERIRRTRRNLIKGGIAVVAAVALGSAVYLTTNTPSHETTNTLSYEEAIRDDTKREAYIG